MGYYTSYKLEIVEGNDFITDYLKEISELSGYSNAFNESATWYDHDHHMRIYSKKHPKTLFKLVGDGEDNGDMWHKYYLDGKMQEARAKIVFDEFDYSKLD